MKKLSSIVLVLVAAFILTACGRSFTVTFDTDGGSSISSVTVRRGETVERPADPTKDGYTFDNWYTEAGTLYDFSTAVTSNLTLTARWIEGNSFIVSFDSDGGSSVASQRIFEDETVTQPADPTKAGYTFVRWELDGAEFNFATPITRSITLKAVWTEGIADNSGRVTVTFNTQGGSAVARQTLDNGERATRPADPTRTGCTFGGWFTTATGNTAFNFDNPITRNVTVFARWNNCPVAPPVVEQPPVVNPPVEPPVVNPPVVEPQNIYTISVSSITNDQYRVRLFLDGVPVAGPFNLYNSFGMVAEFNSSEGAAIGLIPMIDGNRTYTVRIAGGAPISVTR